MPGPVQAAADKMFQDAVDRAVALELRSHRLMLGFLIRAAGGEILVKPVHMDEGPVTVERTADPEIGGIWFRTVETPRG